MLKPAFFHEKVRSILRAFPEEVKRALGKAVLELQKGKKLTYPLSKPLPSVGRGVEEIRVKDRSGAYRVFYLARLSEGVLVFHAFVKKTRETPSHEIELGRKRLKEMLNESTKSLCNKKRI